MANKPSHIDGYNRGFTQTLGNTADIFELDTGDCLVVSTGTVGGGSGSNEPFIKLSPGQDLNPTYSTLRQAFPTGVGAVGYGIVNGLPTWVALTNSVTTTIGALQTSNDGKTWVPRTLPSAPGGAWKSIAFGNGMFVAVAAGTATTTSVAYSNDGITWAFATLPAIASGNMNHVAFGGQVGSGIFCAVALGNVSGTTVFTSRDGITWLAQTSTVGAGNYTSCAWGNPKSDATGQWVFTLLGTTVNTTVYTATHTGTTLSAMTAVTLPTAPLTTGPNAVVFHPNTNIRAEQANVFPTANGAIPQTPQTLTALGGNASAVTTTLTMAVSQTLLSPGTLVSGIGVEDGTFIVSGSGTAYVMSKAQAIATGTTLTFTQVVQPFTPYSGLFLIICASTSLAAGVLFSYDGTTALSVPMPTGITPGAAWQRLAYGQGRVYAINTSTAVNNSIMYSDDGLVWKWIRLPSAPGGAWNTVAVGDILSGLVVLGANSAAVGTAVAQGIVGTTLLAEISTGKANEGFPDLFLTANQQNFRPDITRVF